MSISLAGISMPSPAERGSWSGAAAGAGAGAAAGLVAAAPTGFVLREGFAPVPLAAGLGAGAGALSGALTGAFGVGGGIAGTMAATAIGSGGALAYFGVNDIGLLMAGIAVIPTLVGGIAGALAGAAATD